MAFTRQTEMFLAASPPPTENISRASPADRRETLSHSAKAVSKPSSLIRAVSSETLSVGA